MEWQCAAAGKHSSATESKIFFIVLGLWGELPPPGRDGGAGDRRREVRQARWEVSPVLYGRLAERAMGSSVPRYGRNLSIFVRRIHQASWKNLGLR